MFTVEIPMQLGQKLLPSIVTQSAIHPYTSGAVTRIDRCSTRSCRHQYASIHKVPFTAYSIREYVNLQWTESSRSTDSHVIGATCDGQTDQCAADIASPLIIPISNSDYLHGFFQRTVREWNVLPLQ